MSKGGPKFKELRVWQKGKELAVYVYQITKRNIYGDRERMYRNIQYALKFKIDFGTVENLSPLAICLYPLAFPLSLKII